MYSELPTLDLEGARRLINEIIAEGEAWAESNAAADALEDTAKTLLAQITQEYMLESKLSGGKGIPRTEADMKALSDERYIEHLKNASEARKKANTCRVKYDMGKAYVDLLRSVHATRRTEMSLSTNGIAN